MYPGGPPRPLPLPPGVHPGMPFALPPMPMVRPGMGPPPMGYMPPHPGHPPQFGESPTQKKVGGFVRTLRQWRPAFSVAVELGAVHALYVQGVLPRLLVYQRGRGGAREFTGVAGLGGFPNSHT